MGGRALAAGRANFKAEAVRFPYLFIAFLLCSLAEDVGVRCCSTRRQRRFNVSVSA